MIKTLTLKRSVFVMAFLMLALVGVSSLWRGSTAPITTGDAALSDGDLAYVESNTSFSVDTGSVSGSQVTFGLDGASASSTAVADTMSSAGIAYETDAGCVAEGISEGAANASYVSINTSGYSLPLQSDTYLPVYVSGTYSGTDVYAETSFSGTVLAHSGFNTTNPDFELSDTSTSVGVAYDGGGAGGGGGGGDCGGDPCQLQASLFDRLGLGGSAFMPASFMPANFLFTAADKPVKEKNYKLSFKKQNGIPAFTSGKVKKWKSNVPGTESLDEVSVSLDSMSFQYDVASGTLNLSQKFHLRKAKK
jgi:hypothetical protein